MLIFHSGVLEVKKKKVMRRHKKGGLKTGYCQNNLLQINGDTTSLLVSALLNQNEAVGVLRSKYSKPQWKYMYVLRRK